MPAQVEMTPATEKEPHMEHGVWTQRCHGMSKLGSNTELSAVLASV